jgi:hypothetical protein
LIYQKNLFGKVEIESVFQMDTKMESMRKRKADDGKQNDLIKITF